MRRLLLIITFSFFIVSCSESNKKNEVKEVKPQEKAISIIDTFLRTCNDEIQGNLDTTVMTKSVHELVKTHGIFLSRDGWSLSSFQKKDTIIVESVGKTHNGFGQPIEIKQAFYLTKIENDWIIYDTYNFIYFYPDISIVELSWDFFSDMKKTEIIKNFQNSLKIDVLKKGYKRKYSDGRKGKLKLTNNSKFDIVDVTILIEHFDKDGVSVNTDDIYISNIIRSNGYREFEWMTYDCGKCYSQEFKIKFYKEFN